jgi:hypothetical protein
MVQSTQASPIVGSENLTSSFVRITGTSYEFFFPAPPPNNATTANRDLVTASSGDFSGFPLGTVAKFTGPLNISSVAGFGFTETVGASTMTFTTTSAVSIIPGGQGNIELRGFVTLTGKTPTLATIDIALATAHNSTDTSGTISLISAPEPTSMALMGLGTVGVVGAGFIRRKRGA